MKLFRTIGVLALTLASVACSPYTLKGRVIEGDTSYVSVVDETDPRLNDRGLEGVRLHLQMDPGKLSRKSLTRQTTGIDGAFELPVSEFGAGFMEYDVGLFARRAGYSPADGSFRLPPKSKRILIVMNRGRDFDQGETLEGDWHQMRMYGD